MLMKSTNKTASFVLPIVLCFIVGGLSAWAMRESLAVWYPYLTKPAPTPPGYVFPIVWFALYVCIGVSAGLVLTSRKELQVESVESFRPDGSVESFSRSTVQSPAYGTILRLWIWQLALNFMWSILFFWLRAPWVALIDIIVLDVLIILYIIHTARRHKAAMWLFVPYLAWTLFATYLNAYIAIYN